MPATSTPNQFGDPTLTAAEAASACGPAAAVAFARANGRNPTLREAVDLAKRVGWTPDGGMNGVANQKRLLDAMGVPSELDTGATPDAIRRRAKAGQNVTVSTPVHYYVVDGVDDRGRVHVGQSGLARRGGSEWMTLEDIAAKDGGINGALYQTVADTGGGASVEPENAHETLARLEAAKGKPSVAPAPGQATVKRKKTNAFGRVLGEEEVPNPAPVYRYTYTDGTYVDVRAPASNPDGTPQGAHEIVGGTAMRALARAEAAADRAADAPPRAPVTVNGVKYIWDPEQDSYVEAPGLPAQTPKPGAAPRPVMVNGKPYRVETVPDADPARPSTTRLVPMEVAGAGPAGAKPGRTFVVGRSIYRENDDGTVTKVGEEPRDAPQAPYRSPAQIEKESIDLAAARRDLLPKQQQILQGHLDTVTYVQGMLERGEIDQAQADAYVATSKAAAEAGLRGATPFQEMKEKREAEQANKKLGMDLLTQRLSSGAGLASSLMSSAMGPNVMLRPGQTSLGYDPLAQLTSILGTLQGGEDVTPFARSLLMGAQQPGPPGVPPPLMAGL